MPGRSLFWALVVTVSCATATEPDSVPKPNAVSGETMAGGGGSKPAPLTGGATSGSAAAGKGGSSDGGNAGGSAASAGDQAGSAGAAGSPQAGGGAGSSGAGGTSGAGGVVVAGTAGQEALAGAAGAGGAGACAIAIDVNDYTPTNPGCGGYSTGCKGRIHVSNEGSAAWTTFVLSFGVAPGVTCVKVHSTAKFVITDDGAVSNQCVFTAQNPDGSDTVWSVEPNSAWSFGYDTTQADATAPSDVVVSDPSCP
jgi:hypothetical protein